jgi:hypothetical protein
VRRGWHPLWALVLTLRPLFYFLAPQVVADAIYRRRVRRNRGTVVHSA